MLDRSEKDYSNNIIKFYDNIFPLVEGGYKSATIRDGQRNYKLGKAKAISTSGNKECDMIITEIIYKTYNNLNMVDAENAGYTSVGGLISVLKTIFKDLNKVTIVYFNVLS